MAFKYFAALSHQKKRVYLASDSQKQLILPHKDYFLAQIGNLATALKSGSQNETEMTTQNFIGSLCRAYQIPGVGVQVLHRRPANNVGELHGLYRRDPVARKASITLWMRTAKKTQVVAFKTFLRTALHEFLHHMDFAYYKLPDSFHTEGFYQRESHLVRQLTQP